MTTNIRCINCGMDIDITELNKNIDVTELKKELEKLQIENNKLLAQYHKGHQHGTHGPCCTCQKCDKGYDDCRCLLDDLAKENEQLHKENDNLIALINDFLKRTG